MTNKDTEQEHLPMMVSNHHDQVESANTLAKTKTTTMTTTLVVTNNKCNPITTHENRDNWSNRVVYLLSIIGFVVDLGRVSLENTQFM